MLQAYTEGYKDRVFAEQIQSVQIGYWAGYYSRSKRPKNPSNVIRTMMRKKDNNLKESIGRSESVDVESFLTMDKQFKERLQKQKEQEELSHSG